jgi:hypothetical protein
MSLVRHIGWMACVSGFIFSGLLDMFATASPWFPFAFVLALVLVIGWICLYLRPTLCERNPLPLLVFVVLVCMATFVCICIHFIRYLDLPTGNMEFIQVILLALDLCFLCLLFFFEVQLELDKSEPWVTRLSPPPARSRSPFSVSTAVLRSTGGFRSFHRISSSPVVSPSFLSPLLVPSVARVYKP